MFGELEGDLEFLRLSKGVSSEEAVQSLLQCSRNERVSLLETYPLGCFLHTVFRDRPESGSIYVFDRKESVWIWIDFKDSSWRYSVADIELLLNRSGFRCLVEAPHKLRESKWFIQPDHSPVRLV